MSKFEALNKALEKQFGANDEEQSVTQWLDTGFPNLNLDLSGKINGGFGYGRIYEIYGASSSGKTAIAVEDMIEAQRLGGAAIFIDHEQTLDTDLAEHQGLNVERPFWFYKRPESWEKGNDWALDVAEFLRGSDALDKDAPIIIVQDSIAEACPKSCLDKKLVEFTMNDMTALSRTLSLTFKSIKKRVAEVNAVGLYLNQIRTKPGVTHGDPTTTPGGVATEFACSGRISFGKTRIVDKETKDLIGQTVNYKIQKSKHTRPFSTGELKISFAPDGTMYFNKVETYLDFLIEKELLIQAGARVEWEGKNLYKSVLIKQLNEDPTGLDQLKALVATLLPKS